MENDEYRISAFHSILSCISEPYKSTSLKLFSYLNKLNKNSEKNGMDDDIISQRIFLHLKIPKKVLQFIILQYDSIFNDSKIEYMEKKGFY